MSILDLSDKLDPGVLFRPPNDKLCVDAYVPTIGWQSHAANLLELDNGDLLCAWFAGSREGISDVNIALSRLPHGAARWTEPGPTVLPNNNSSVQAVKLARFTEDWLRDQLDWLCRAESEKKSEL